MLFHRAQQPRVSAHEARVQHRADTAAAIERYAARSRALREGGATALNDEPLPGRELDVDHATRLADGGGSADVERVAEERDRQSERPDVDMEMEMELVRRRRAVPRQTEGAGAAEMQRRYAAATGMYGGFGGRPPPNCPAQAVLVWMGCQVLILMDIVRVPSNCVTIGGRDQCITCELGADLDYSQCALPWHPSAESGISFENTVPLDFYNECCAAHPYCCTPTSALAPGAGTTTLSFTEPQIKAQVQGQPCCDALCAAHGPEADRTAAQLEAQEITEVFYCDGFTLWYLTYVGVYFASVVVVASAAKNDGSASACLTLTVGIIILYWVRTRVVPYGANRHTYIYPAAQFFEYAVMSDLFLWMMTRRARAMRLHYERTTRHIGRMEDLEAARQRDRDELDRAAEQLAQRPIEPLPAVKPVERGAVGAIVEGITMADMETDRDLAMSANPLMLASVSVGDVVHQRELQRDGEVRHGVSGSGGGDEEDYGGEPLPLRVASSAVVIQPPTSAGDDRGGVMTVLARLTPPSSPSSTGTSGAVVAGIADPATRPRHSVAAVEDDSDEDMV
eukprot:COSAG02_NODE_2968_length_7640_cov_10.957831_2_plen_566_part_00